MYYYKRLKRNLIDFYKTRILAKHYKKNFVSDSINSKYYIYMCDGKIHHGGLADRLHGIVSTYAYCKEFNKDFKIYYTYPYNLKEFLLPNKYNWEITKEELIYDKNIAKPVLISRRQSVKEQKKLAKKLLENTKSQTHVYTNMKYDYDNNFKFLFKELFKPSKYLSDAIKEQQNLLNKNYISITFRFQQLLGDFKEGNFPIIKNNQERINLINNCKKFIEYVHNENQEIEKILVTSDSITFLNYISDINYVYTIPGRIIHMDYNGKDENLSVHLKSFLDLFMIANAKKIYSVVYPPLFHSGFPFLASLINGNEYIEVSDFHINK